MGTGRLEAFSDGVIAVAITLLALGIAVPPPGDGALGHALLDQWPRYAAYAVSFLTIGIIWINHHLMISRLRAADHSILVLNLLLLMTIGVLPFATDLVASYLRRPGESLAAAVYAGCFLLMALAFITLNRRVLTDRGQLLREPIAAAARRHILIRSAAGIVPYAAATPLAFVSPYVTLGVCGAVAVYYALPIAAGAGFRAPADDPAAPLRGR
jgi:uncharacterized membrane protein